MEAGSERVCYVHCSFCNTVLVVNVPCYSMLNIVTVRCGHCTNLLPVNMGSLPQPSSTQINIPQQQRQHNTDTEQGALMTSSANEWGSASSSSPSKIKINKLSGSCEPLDRDQQPLNRPLPPVRPLEKRQRVPSAYNRFIKEEIQRIKASNPDISHREAFIAAAKNWAHFPHIHFGLKTAKVVD